MDSLTKPPFGVTSAEVVINCPDRCPYQKVFQDFPPSQLQDIRTKVQNQFNGRIFKSKDLGNWGKCQEGSVVVFIWGLLRDIDGYNSGQFIIKMDDLGVPLFLETSIFVKNWRRML